MVRSIKFTIEQGDLQTFDADVVALKYAQEFHGADRLVATILNTKGNIPLDSLRPNMDDYRLVPSNRLIQARYVLFVGVTELYLFDYARIRQFSANVLGILAAKAPQTRHVALTIHGVGIGLDEAEAMRAEFAGFLDSIRAGKLPESLQRISIVDRNEYRIKRIRETLDQELARANYATQVEQGWGYQVRVEQQDGAAILSDRSTGAIEEAGVASKHKPAVFVARPFSKDLEDTFYYGIQKPVNGLGLLCEDFQQEAFLGDILARVKQKIEEAAIVIAVLTGSNPNVFLEVGYAWGKERPTILIAKAGEELPFDVRGQRCIKYESIKDLEQALTNHLQQLKSQRIF